MRTIKRLPYLCFVALCFWCCFLALGFPLIMLSGCATGRNPPRSPSSTVTTAGGGSFTQSGDAATPANVSTSTGRSSFTVPANVPVRVEPDGAALFTSPAPLTFSASFEAVHANGPAAFTPPAPPTPTDEAAGRASLWFRLGLAAGIAAGVFGLVKGWDAVAIGGGAVAAACLVALSLAAIPVWVWIALGVGAAAIVGGPALWHLRVKHMTPAPAAPPAPSPSG